MSGKPQWYPRRHRRDTTYNLRLAERRGLSVGIGGSFGLDGAAEGGIRLPLATAQVRDLDVICK